MALNLTEFLARHCVPETDRPPSARDQRLAVGREDDRVEAVAFVADLQPFLAGGQLPQMDDLGVGGPGRGEGFSVWTQRQRAGGATAFEGVQRLAGAGLAMAI